MRRFSALIYIDGRRSEVSVDARDQFEAERLIRSQYNVRGKISVGPDFKYEHELKERENKKKYEHELKERESRKRHQKEIYPTRPSDNENLLSLINKLALEKYRKQSQRNKRGDEEGSLSSVSWFFSMMLVASIVVSFFVIKQFSADEKNRVANEELIIERDNKEVEQLVKRQQQKEAKEKIIREKEEQQFLERSQAYNREISIKQGMDLQKVCLDAGGKHENCDRLLCTYGRDFFPCNTLPSTWDGISPWVAPTSPNNFAERKRSQKSSKPKKPKSSDDVFDIFD